MHTRRDVLKSSAAATAAAGLLAAGALSSTEDDAELIALWQQWKAKWDACGVAWREMDTADERASEETSPRWEWCTGIGCWTTPGVPFSITFRSFKDGEPIYQTIDLKAKTLP